MHFELSYKRLEVGRFAKVAPTKSISAASTNAVSMTDTQLLMWLDGIELERTTQRKRFVLRRDLQEQQDLRDIGQRI